MDIHVNCYSMQFFHCGICYMLREYKATLIMQSVGNHSSKFTFLSINEQTIRLIVAAWMSWNAKLPKICINFLPKTMLSWLFCAQNVTYWSAVPLCLDLMHKIPENIPILQHMCKYSQDLLKYDSTNNGGLTLCLQGKSHVWQQFHRK